MNRRDFFEWVGRLFAALPFVVLVDIEPELETISEIDSLTRTKLPITTPAKQTLDGKTISSIYLKDTLVLQGQYSDEQIQDFQQRLLELNSGILPLYTWKE